MRDPASSSIVFHDFDEDDPNERAQHERDRKKPHNSRSRGQPIRTTDVTDIYARNLWALQREALTGYRAQREPDKTTVEMGLGSEIHHNRRDSGPVFRSVIDAQAMFRTYPLFRMTPMTDSHRDRRRAMSDLPHGQGTQSGTAIHEQLSGMVDDGDGGHGCYINGKPCKPVHTGIEGGVLEYDEDDWDEDEFDDEFGGEMMYDLSRAPSRLL